MPPDVGAAAAGPVVVVGNPKRESRTREAALVVAERVTGAVPQKVIELADLGSALLDFRSAEVGEAKRAVLEAPLLVVASPTFKGTFSGLLKLFLDQFAAGELKGTPTVPLMLGANLRHALAPELSLRPVLVEIGASCPYPGLFLLDSSHTSGPELDAWLALVDATRQLGVDKT